MLETPLPNKIEPNYASSTRSGSTLALDSYDVDIEKQKEHHSREHGVSNSPLYRTETWATGKSSNPGVEPSRVESLLSVVRARGAPRFDHPLSHHPTRQDVIVDFEGPDDPYDPRNWPSKKKAITVFFYAMTTLTSGWASSSFSVGNEEVAKRFQVGSQVAVLGTSLFLLGLGFGPLIWAPLSEVYGRRLAILVPMVPAICFSFGTATAENIQTVMITRFFTGFFAAAPLTNTGGVLADLFSPAERGYGMAGYTAATVWGPMLAPLVSAAFVVNPSLGWRWTEYFTGILQAAVLLVDIIFLDECYRPYLLVVKARRLRIESGNWALHAKFEEWDVSITELTKKFLVRPFQLLCTPICALMAVYASFCYGVLYMQLGIIPIIFSEIRGWSLVTSECAFLAITVGSLIALLLNTYNQTLYNKAYYAGGENAVPEKRLPPIMAGSVLFAASQFLIGWTASPNYPWIAPMIGLAMLGCGFLLIFQNCLNYLIDTFTQYAASAVAANTFLRSSFAAGLPLAVGPLYHNIGPGPGSSITGGFACLLVPVPFIFYLYGERIRAASKWSRDSVPRLRDSPR